MKDKFDIVEKDGVVIYDESDDYDPGEDEVVGEGDAQAGGFRLMSNKEIFTDEYMQNYARKMDAEMAKEERTQRLISVGVVVAVVLFIGLVTYVNIKDLL